MNAATAHGGELSVIKLKHRTAEDIIQVIKPHLGPGDSISGQKYVIFLNTTPENLVRIKSIINTLDRALRQLLITVVQGENAQTALDSVDASGNVSIGDHSKVKFGRQPQPEDTIAVTGRSAQAGQSDTDIQQVRVQEGTSARIYIGLSVPVSEGRTGTRQYGRAVEYREIRTGFEVLPRLSGDRFVLNIASQRESAASAGQGVVDTQQIQTRIQGRLNAWIDIGGILGETQGREAGPIYRKEEKLKNRTQVFIKLVEIGP
jgi:hypothetical protein